MFPVLVDTCVLLPITVADLLLRLAETKTYRVLWSDEILDELERNLIGKIGVAPVAARKRIDAMREHFPGAMVEDYEALSASMTCDAKDRHVLAAAVRSNAELLVTFNGKDFPPSSTRPYDVEIVTPDDFLLDQLDLFPETVIRCAQEQASAYRDPSLTFEGLLQRFEACNLPLFVAALRYRIDPHVGIIGASG